MAQKGARTGEKALYASGNDLEAASARNLFYSFQGSDGSYPWAALIQAADGTFYGTTTAGLNHAFAGVKFRFDLGTTLPRLVPGECNTDGAVDLSDGICLLGFLFLGAPAKLPCGEGTTLDPGNDSLLNWNADQAIDLSDAIALLGWLFLGGPQHSLAVPGNPEACVAIADCPDSSDCTP